MRYVLTFLVLCLATPLHARDAEIQARDAEIDRLHAQVAALEAQLQQIQGSSCCTQALALEGKLKACLQGAQEAVSHPTAPNPEEPPLLRTDPAVIPGTAIHQVALQWRNKPWGTKETFRAIAYSVTIANPTDQPVTVTARVEFLDSEGLLVDRQDLDSVELEPSAQHTFDGEKKFRAKEVNRVTSMRIVRR